ncbi:MAG: hypothetical protein IMZ64_13030 [Bacteroidetes bacterium]|nr:hypothetical protein [Bacteroidota bacterium]
MFFEAFIIAWIITGHFDQAFIIAFVLTLLIEEKEE